MAASQASVITAYGIPLDVRPITPADRERLGQAFGRLSERARRDRFLATKPWLSPDELTYLTNIDHRSHEALAAVDPASGDIVGVARYATPPGETGVADMAVTVLDVWQGQGIGTLLGRRLLRRAADNGIARLTATTFADNRPARALLHRLGFKTTWFGGGVIDYERQ
jgi:RimJ/RimL family protein N-acetyltransferase